MSELLQGILDRLFGADHQTALVQLGHFSGTVFLALLVVLITIYMASRIRRGVHAFFRKRGDLGLAILLGRTSYFLILYLGALIVLRVFGLDAAVLFTSLGVVGLAVGLALQDVLKNVIAGIYLLIERPFKPGETIKVRDFVGIVESIELRTTLLRGTDAIIHVPNAILFSEILVNRGVLPPVEKVVATEDVPRETAYPISAPIPAPIGRMDRERAGARGEGPEPPGQAKEEGKDASRSR